MQRSFLIVGAGIIGAAAALQLVRAGHRVRVLQGGAADATKAAFGWINASFFVNDDHHALRVAGMDAWRRLLDTVPIDVAWQGCLCWDMPVAELEATFTRLRALDYPVEVLNQTEVAAKEPALKEPPAHALWFPSEGAAPSQVVAAKLLQAAQSLGAQLITNVHVTRVFQHGTQAVGVDTTAGQMLADHVIVAAGTGTQKLAASVGVDVPLVPRPAYIMRTTAQTQMLNHVLATPDGEIRQEPSGQILMPVAVSHQGDATTELTQTPDAAADNAMARLRHVLHGLDDARWAEVILAERPVPKDDLPVVGEIAKGVTVAVLHSGITLGPLIGELIAKDVSGRLDNADAALLAPYRPDRASLHQA